MDYFDFAQIPVNLENQFGEGSYPESGQQGTTASSSRTPTTVSASTAFNPQSMLDTQPSDLILVSSDSVFFYVHCHRISGASTNYFNGLLSPARLQEANSGTPLHVLPEVAEVLNIVVHTIYGMPCTHFGPSFATATTAIKALTKYGVPVQQYAAPALPLYTLIRSYAPTHAIDAYALAAAHDLEPLAVAISPHLLAFHLSALSEELASALGPKYLLRLFHLHGQRMDALKHLLLQLPTPHEPTAVCGVEEQGKLTRGWAFAAAQLVWDARPSISTHAIDMALSPLRSQLSCHLCINSLEQRLQEVISEWAAVKNHLVILCTSIAIVTRNGFLDL
ncbi:hypothetical protein CERSUDRAFT_63441 [Gelatoporia subvermispora B]|uniref:BTB domain-containing protein n=1 Tax=Ceriporiopsis subvermispora (strain B) TaxID=914234 RepID=M2R5T1_CERS8|nr:hypothetical protein CERSUDRAFT_63441 [Gelatoporia subvermispora B]